jgi:hypothetical protein
MGSVAVEPEGAERSNRAHATCVPRGGADEE